MQTMLGPALFEELDDLVGAQAPSGTTREQDAGRVLGKRPRHSPG